MRIILFILTAISLSSCVSARWVSDMKPPEALDGDYSQCEMYAHDRYPPNMYLTTKTVYQNIRVNSQNCHHNCMINHHHNQSQTISVPQEKVVSEDANSVPRMHAFNHCMSENGWYKEYK